jgi:hypothetical protein
MAQPLRWLLNNDVGLTVSGVKSSTMSSTAYVNSSTTLTVSVWKALTTGATTNRIINARVMSYIAASQGNYRTVVQSTESTGIAEGTKGLLVFRLAHSGLNAEWRAPFLGQYRRTT